VFLLGLAGEAVHGWYAQTSAKADIPNILSPAAPPAGESGEYESLGSGGKTIFDTPGPVGEKRE
jgi:hypothetical protein